MTSFDHDLKRALSAEDEAFIDEAIHEQAFYKEAFASLKGPGSAMNILAWGGIMVASVALIWCVYGLVTADTVRRQILYAAFAIMLNSAQIALKLWFNMRLNRHAVMAEIMKLRLAMARE